MSDANTHRTRRFYVATGWRDERPHAVVDGRSARIVSDWPSQEAADAAARELNGCRICGQHRPHRADCPKFGSEDSPIYYGEDDSE